MRSIIAVLVMFSVCDAQEFRIHSEIVEKPNGAVKVKTIIDETKPRQRSEKDVYVVKFTGDHCPHCKAPKLLAELEKIRKSGYKIVEVNVSEDSKWTEKSTFGSGIPSEYVVDSIPRFWIVDSDTRKPRRQIRGVIRLEDLEMKSSPPAARPGFYNPSIYGQTGTSHESRQTLIRHLLNDGIHRGRYDLQTLNSMSDDELNAAHSRDHNN